MAVNAIKHRGVITEIKGSVVSVKIIQASNCAVCHAKKYCLSTDCKEKTIHISTINASAFQKGDEVFICGNTAIGLKAVLFAFVFPFMLVVLALFAFIAITGNELYAALLSLAMLLPYYAVIRLNENNLKKNLIFTLEPINNNSTL